MSTGIPAAAAPRQPTGSIIITSPHENVVATCKGIQASQKMSKGKHAPKYAMFTTENSASAFGARNIFLGWYADEDLLQKEINEIQSAIAKGIPTYTLQYSCKVKFRWGFPHIME